MNRLPLGVLVVLLTSAAVSSCDTDPEGVTPEDASTFACELSTFRSNISTERLSVCLDMASESECRQAAVNEAATGGVSVRWDYDSGRRCTPPPDAPNPENDGSCESDAYTSSYGAGEEQLDYMCKTAWAYGCAGNSAAVTGMCDTIESYAGSASQCPYC